MDFETYSPLALRTARRLDPKGDFIHAVLGLCTETAELLRECGGIGHLAGHREKIIDECGDVMWYWNLAVVSLEFDRPYLIRNTGNYPQALALAAAEALNAAANLADPAKKLLIANKPLNPVAIAIELKTIIRGLRAVLQGVNSGWEAAFAANIEKLSARYPELRFEADRMSKINRQAEQNAQAKVLHTHDARKLDDNPGFAVPGDLTSAMLVGAQWQSAPAEATSQYCTSEATPDCGCNSSSDSGSCSGGGE